METSLYQSPARKLLNKFEAADAKQKEDNEGVQVFFLVASLSKKKTRIPLSYTVNRLVEECTSRKINNRVILADSTEFIVDKGKMFLDTGTKKIAFSKNNTIFIARKSILNSSKTKSLLEDLEDEGCTVINPLETIEVCADKYVTYERLTNYDVSTPKTILITSEDDGEDILSKVDKELGKNYPIVGKILNSTHGVGVFKIDSRDSLVPYIQTIHKLNPDEDVILQEFIKSDSDYRVHVFKGEVIAVMERIHKEDEFRNNVHQGASVKLITDAPTDLQDLAIKASEAVEGVWVGVDIIKDSKDNYYVLEVNSSAGTKGIETASKGTDTNIIKSIIDGALGSVELTKGTEVGPVNTIEIVGAGQLSALFDTGNSTSSCSLDSKIDNIDDKKNEVTFTVGDETITKPILKRTRIKSNTSKTDEYETRIVVLMDIKFNGKTIKDYPVNLHPRHHKRTPVLVNLDLIRKLGVIINPSM